jgi:hypothetical protein
LLKFYKHLVEISTLTHKGGKMKIKLLENDKVIEVPNYWKWHLVDGRKVIIDQNKKIIALVIEK